MKNILKQVEKFREIIMYLFWGGMTTVVSWGSYSLFVLLFRQKNTVISVFGVKMSSDVLVANVLSWFCAVLFAFVTNKLWVFQSKSWKSSVLFPELGKFISARLVTGVFEIIAVPVLVGKGLDQTIFGIEGMIAKVLVSVLVVLVNYIFSKLFIFQQNK